MKVTGTCKESVTLIDERGFDAELEAMVGNVRNVPWTQKDVDILTRYYGKVKTHALATKLGRTPASISAKVRELGIPFKTPVKGE